MFEFSLSLLPPPSSSSSSPHLLSGISAPASRPPLWRQLDRCYVASERCNNNLKPIYTCMRFRGCRGAARVLGDTTLLHSRFRFGRLALLGPRHGPRELPPLLLFLLLLREGEGGGGGGGSRVEGGPLCRSQKAELSAPSPSDFPNLRTSLPEGNATVPQCPLTSAPIETARRWPRLDTSPPSQCG